MTRPLPWMPRAAAALLALAALGLSLGTVSPAAAQSASVAADPPAVADYSLGAGDVVRISVFQNPDLTLETR
ncbi:MAG: polysaccharide biosynthesis/export family protein, partial [Burkholderiales bacterium]|nr:polysaccharide biosynthesis/export family protein [Burkholderiales bacterium]